MAVIMGNVGELSDEVKNILADIVEMILNKNWDRDTQFNQYLAILLNIKLFNVKFLTLFDVKSI